MRDFQIKDASEENGESRFSNTRKGQNITIFISKHHNNKKILHFHYPDLVLPRHVSAEKKERMSSVVHDEPATRYLETKKYNL